MTKEVMVDEPIDVLVRMMTDGTLRPTSFLWRERTRYVADVGRQWEERRQGKTLRFYLVQTVENNTYELYFDPATDHWSIGRAWLRDLMV